MKGFINLLVHKYGDIDDEKAFNDIKEGLQDFEMLIDEVEKFLKRERFICIPCILHIVYIR